MEFGPRALGGRSVLGDPRSETMQKTLNLKVQIPGKFPALRAFGTPGGCQRVV